MEPLTTDERETVLAMMQAMNEHIGQLRAAIDVLTKRVDELEGP